MQKERFCKDCGHLITHGVKPRYCEACAAVRIKNKTRDSEKKEEAAKRRRAANKRDMALDECVREIERVNAQRKQQGLAPLSYGKWAAGIMR
ncbi:MAG: hypothetical protein GXZ14_00905 [Ruminococcaceae bacterium]|nr:hypothetical protein [Oscillospiraceae bacterium]